MWKTKSQQQIYCILFYFDSFTTTVCRCKEGDDEEVAKDTSQNKSEINFQPQTTECKVEKKFSFIKINIIFFCVVPMI
jgi:hypothetical protein